MHNDFKLIAQEASASIRDAKHMANICMLTTSNAIFLLLIHRLEAKIQRHSSHFQWLGLNSSFEAQIIAVLYLRSSSDSMFPLVGFWSAHKAPMINFHTQLFGYTHSVILISWKNGFFPWGSKKERKRETNKTTATAAKIPFVWQALKLNTAFSLLSPLFCYIKTYFPF